MEEKNKIDNQKFQEFFFYGIDNQKELKEGILYFSTKKVYKRHRFENWYENWKKKLYKKQLQSTDNFIDLLD